MEFRFTKDKTFLVTGAAGFIGYHISDQLCRLGATVIAVDNLNDYYDIQLKKDRLGELNQFKQSGVFKFYKIDIADEPALKKIFSEYNFEGVIHLAAQAGVRYSLENPQVYIQSNVVGFMNILECCRHSGNKNLIYASSSSVYGGNTNYPFRESDRVDNQISIYAATKKANELMANVYSELYGLNTIGLRFFTVYGPWGRPDMALFKFTKCILEKTPIPLYNNGQHQRSFTYISDVVHSILLLLDKYFAGNTSLKSNQIFNIGGHKAVELMDYISEIEKAVGKNAEFERLPLQAGDVKKTEADCTLLHSLTGFEPKISIKEGVEQFVKWYNDYQNKNEK